ncbi:MAG: hypothetical protein R2762_01865 [Bryobacteraceae bacterium]
MSGHEPSHGSGSEQPKYELRDANLSAVIKSGWAVFITVLIAFGLMYGMYKALSSLPVDLGRQVTTMEMNREIAPGPQLLVDEPGNLKQFRAAEQEMLTTYQKDSHSGAIRIPVSEAMKAVAHRGAGIVTGAKPAEAAKK